MSFEIIVKYKSIAPARYIVDDFTLKDGCLRLAISNNEAVLIPLYDVLYVNTKVYEEETNTVQPDSCKEGVDSQQEVNTPV